VCGAGERADGTGSPRQQLWSGRVTGVSDPVFDPVLCFHMRVYRGIVSTE